MSEAVSLEVQPRKITGKKVRQLRVQGIIPGVIYGPTHPDPLSVQVDWKVLRPVLRRTGGTEMIALSVDGETINVLVRDVHRHPVRGDVLHIDFYAVDVNVVVKISVPVVVINEEATSKRLGTEIYHMLTSVEVESLPGSIPSHIEIDLSLLNAPGEHLTVANLPQIDGIKYLEDPEQTVVRAAALTAEAEEGEEEEIAGATAEVEVIRKGKAEEEEEEE